MAAVVNGGSYQAAQTTLPALNTTHTEIQAVVDPRPAGDTLEEVTLWNGEDLTPSTTLNLLPDANKATTSQKASAKRAVTVKLASATYISSAAVEKAVEQYFADIPVMIDIARCESQFRQYDAAGDVLHGKVNYADRGVMQINEAYHSAEALKLGMDILTLQGNMEFARHLYDEQGTQPWISSSSCWGGSDSTQIAQK
ncbi:MAG TPA: hypothetical protein VHF05_03155 [Candidatus Paceibacterota bacterium]|nr:hypothetical protein [Candidatus Paceibacterota bacterium]